jgi:hypothetical protein
MQNQKINLGLFDNLERQKSKSVSRDKKEKNSAHLALKFTWLEMPFKKSQWWKPSNAVESSQVLTPGIRRAQQFMNEIPANT